MINQLEFLCEEVAVTYQKVTMNSMVCKTFVIANIVDEESIMENLNFEDVMNYYGVSAVCEWCEANR